MTGIFCGITECTAPGELERILGHCVCVGGGCFYWACGMLEHYVHRQEV